ncbi:GTPase [uncultured Dokdonia sp.]|uniref:GTPase n=1 Tax=uncultured Dokdonia sp. TaxID=575653 RepID=UPI00261114EE|nr:GTPase [uncultured Dokdonia sp.]
MRKLIFVYNANSGVVNTWVDIAHKIVSPTTYACDLCGLTHGRFSEKRTWKKFRDTHLIDMEFLYKDQFLKKYKSKWLPKYTFPVILISDAQGLQPFMIAQDFQEIVSVEMLIQRIERFIKQLDTTA